MPLPPSRPTSPDHLLDEIHRLEGVRDDAILEASALDWEYESEMARRIVHRVDGGSSVEAARRQVVAELIDTKQRLVKANATVERASNHIAHYRFLLEHLPGD